jgi:hypothetical protein
MIVEIVIRDQRPPNTGYVKAPISMEAMEAMTVEERKDALYDSFLRAYYELTGKAF